MKAIIFVLSLMIGANASAESPFGEFNARFIGWKGKGSYQAAIPGKLVIDTKHDEIKVTVVYVPCPPPPPGGATCMAMPYEIDYDLKVISKSVGICDETIIIAQHDQTPVDGALTQITLVDNSNNICVYVKAPPQLAGELWQKNPWTGMSITGSLTFTAEYGRAGTLITK